MKALEFSLIKVYEGVEPLENLHQLHHQDVPRMVMADMAQLMADDVGIDILIREKGIAEERIGSMFFVGKHHGIAIHLALG